MVVSAIDWNFKLSELDMIHLWQEVWLLLKSGEDYFLTDEENAIRRHESVEFKSTTDEVEQLEQYLAQFIGKEITHVAAVNKGQLSVLITGGKKMTQFETRNLSEYMVNNWGRARTFGTAKRAWLVPHHPSTTVENSHKMGEKQTVKWESGAFTAWAVKVFE